MAEVPTMRVRYKQGGHDVLINRDDFDPRLHEPWREPEPEAPAERAAEPARPPVPDEPRRRGGRR